MCIMIEKYIASHGSNVYEWGITTRFQTIGSLGKTMALHDGERLDKSVPTWTKYYYIDN